MTAIPGTLPAQTSQTKPPQTNGHITDPKPPRSGLPKLPLPKLEDTCSRYLTALEGLQDEDEHAKTKAIVADFLASGEGEKWQRKLEAYNEGVESYIEEFWWWARKELRGFWNDRAHIRMETQDVVEGVGQRIDPPPELETPLRQSQIPAAASWSQRRLQRGSVRADQADESYLNHSDSVVLSLNPFFVLSSDVTPRVHPQLSRASSLILSSLSFIHDQRNGLLQPDEVRGTPLDMSQYERLFGACRVPTDHGCRMQVNNESRHVVVIRRGQFYWFDCLDSENRPLLSDKEIFSNLEAIMKDADRVPVSQVAQSALGILTTESRKIWSNLRRHLIKSNRSNASSLGVVESALFVVCLDDYETEDLNKMCANFLCGSYELDGGVQVGTCTNRWYDKLQIIVCSNGEAGINFEHTGVDGHTVLRYAADVYTELVLLFAKTINPSTPSLFKAKPSPYSKALRKKASQSSTQIATPSAEDADIDTSPRKLEWELTPDLRAGVRYAETRISDLICQNDSQAMEFGGYGGAFIKRHGFSPDAFVQMAFQAAYYSLYGRVESTYEPAMTKAFKHGRTEAIRTVQPESVAFAKTFCSETATAEEKLKALHKACKRHTVLTKECSAGQGHDRHLYAMYSLVQRELHAQNGGRGSPKPSQTANGGGTVTIPEIFSDPGYNLLATSVLSTSNCGNPALRLFGFGPVTPEGYGIGYIIKEEGISICMSSKHLQTRRLLNTLQAYLVEVRALLIQQWRAANERPDHFVDHAGILRDARTGKAISSSPDLSDSQQLEEEMLSGFGFFDIGANDQSEQSKRRRKPQVGRTLTMSEY